MKKNLSGKTTLCCCFIIAAFCSGCYFHNTPAHLGAEGFHEAINNPLAGDSITGLANDGKNVVAVTRSGKIAYSSNSGISWEEVASTGFAFNSVTWGEGWFLAAGDGGQAVFSSNGRTWESYVIGPMSPKNIVCVAAGAIRGRPVFVAAGEDGRIAHAVDSPGGPWFMADLTPFGGVQGSGEEVRAAAYGTIRGNGVFVAAGVNGKIAFMKDFSGKWYGGRAGTGETFNSLAFGNDRFIVTGRNGMIKYALDPTDYTWTLVQDTEFGFRHLTGAAFDPKIKHFVAYTADNIVGLSEFGVDWTAANFSGRFSAGISAISCTSSRIILGGGNGILLYSN